MRRSLGTRTPLTLLRFPSPLYQRVRGRRARKFAGGDAMLGHVRASRGAGMSAVCTPPRGRGAGRAPSDRSPHSAAAATVMLQLRKDQNAASEGPENLAAIKAVGTSALPRNNVARPSKASLRFRHSRYADLKKRLDARVLFALTAGKATMFGGMIAVAHTRSGGAASPSASKPAPGRAAVSGPALMRSQDRLCRLCVDTDSSRDPASKEFKQPLRPWPRRARASDGHEEETLT